MYSAIVFVSHELNTTIQYPTNASNIARNEVR
jgi:hypothetical protein